MRTVFLVGNPSNQNQTEKLQNESKIFNDIVQEDFMDTYANLTLKTVMAFKWSAKYCPQAKFLLKIDDDILVNSYYLKNYLHAVKQKENSTSDGTLKNTFMCLRHVNTTVIRNTTHKYYVSKEDYKEDVYKPYCSGINCFLNLIGSYSTDLSCLELVTGIESGTWKSR